MKMSIKKLVFTGTATLSLLAASVALAETDDHADGYRYGQEVGQLHCNHPPKYPISALAVCGYNQRRPDASPEVLDWIAGCVSGYATSFPSCNSSG